MYAKMQTQNQSKPPMNMDSIRIDWDKAISEIEEFIDLESKLSKRRTIDNMDSMMYGMKLLCDVRDMYRKDDITGYLDILDNNRNFLKVKY